SEPAPQGPATEARLGSSVELVDPSSLTIGVVLAEIKELVGQLGSLVSQVGGEMKSVVLTAQGSASQLIAELDATFAGRYDTLIRDLTDQEARLVEDSLAVVDHLE